LFEAKEGDNFNHRNTLSISRINPPKFGGGLKFEPDAGVGQKGAFCKSLGTVLVYMMPVKTGTYMPAFYQSHKDIYSSAPKG